MNEDIASTLGYTIGILFASVVGAFITAFVGALLLGLCERIVVRDAELHRYWHHYWTCVFAALASIGASLVLGFAIGYAGLWSEDIEPGLNLAGMILSLLITAMIVSSRMRVTPGKASLIVLLYYVFAFAALMIIGFTVATIAALATI